MSDCLTPYYQPLWRMSIEELEIRLLNCLREVKFDHKYYNALNFVLDNRKMELRNAA